MIPESQIKTSRSKPSLDAKSLTVLLKTFFKNIARRSDGSYDEDESMLAISPNKMHSSNMAESSSIFAEPLCFTTSIAASKSGIPIEERRAEIVVFELNLASHMENDGAADTSDFLMKQLAKAAHCQTSSEFEICEKVFLAR